MRLPSFQRKNSLMNEASKFLSNIPLYDVNMSVTCSLPSVARVEVPVRVFGESAALPIVTLPPDSECTLEIQFTLTRGNSQQHRGNTTTAATVHDPKYHKPKEVSWWVVLGSLSTGELLATKRTSISGRQACVTVEFVTSNESIPDDMCLFILSDCLLGIDMNYAFTIQT